MSNVINHDENDYEQTSTRINVDAWIRGHHFEANLFEVGGQNSHGSQVSVFNCVTGIIARCRCGITSEKVDKTET